MARPARFNADYFTHSADLRNDRRVKAIRTAYGAAGYGIFTMLLEALTDADNTALAVDEMEIELLAGDFGVSATEIHSLLQFGVKVGYFATNGAGLLTCPELNSWLAPVFDKRNRARNAAPAALLPQPVTVMPVSVTVNPQSKVKESKVNTTDVVASAPEALKANPAKQMAAAVTDPEDEQRWSVGPLNKPRPFTVICERLGFLEIDFEHYRKQALVAAEDADISRTINQWSSWIRNYLNNQLKNGPLLKMQAGGGTLPSQPTPDRDYPQPGHERPGQVFYIGGASGDQNLDKMAAAARLKYFPAATIVSLAYPQTPYIMQDGNVVRR